MHIVFAGEGGHKLIICFSCNPNFHLAASSGHDYGDVGCIIQYSAVPEEEENFQNKTEQLSTLHK